MSEMRLIYKGKKFNDILIKPICYNPKFFQMELDLESDVFYEIRKNNWISPAKINQSCQKDLKEIKAFFEKNKNNFYFLFHGNGDLIGSILHVRNYIQSLSVSKKYQRQGYGEKLSKYCINKIIDQGYACVELNVLNGNAKAERLYKKIGFVEIK